MAGGLQRQRSGGTIDSKSQVQGFESSLIKDREKIMQSFYFVLSLHFKSRTFLKCKMQLNHRYRKSQNRLLTVYYVPATSRVLKAFFSSFFAAAINSTNEANKAASMCS